MVVIGSLLLTALAWLLSGLKTLLVAVFSKYAVPLFVALAAFLGFNYFAKDRILDSIEVYEQAINSGVVVETGTLTSSLISLQGIVQQSEHLQFGFYCLNVETLGVVLTATTGIVFACVTAKIARSATSLALGRG